MVGPYRLEGAGSGHVKLGVLLAVIAIEPQPESPDPRKELGYGNLLGHVSPIAAVS